jgi:hypothetical protein
MSPSCAAICGMAVATIVASMAIIAMLAITATMTSALFEAWADMGCPSIGRARADAAI